MLKALWKPTAILLVVIAAWFWIGHIKATAYKAGEAASEARQRAELDRVNIVNRAREKALSDSLRGFADKVAQLTADRHQREQVIVTKLDEKIAAQPPCEVDPEIVRLRNEVRAQ